jgi:glucose-6-phosphate isomerase
MSLLQQLLDSRIASRIWQRDSSVFAPESAGAAVHQAITGRLGWLAAPETMAAELPRLHDFAERAGRDGLTTAYLLGMGGSSLCAEVLRDTAPAAQGRISLSVLDTTDEHAIDQAAADLTPAAALCLVASKSGTTIEVSSLERYFGSLVARAVGDKAGAHFVAITDPDTPLVTHARDRGYRHTFINPADIGGRYSALSLFGLVPAALLGWNLESLLAKAGAMAQQCRDDRDDNPGLALGAFMAEHAVAGRDKLTVLLPSRLAPLGPWIEQLVAESTGKNGRGILPVVDEPLGEPAEYGADRMFVLIDAPDTPGDLDRAAQSLQSAGHPVFRFAAGDLAGEFFRWEFATAVAGAGIGVNPFDEPNVREAKARTQALLDAFRATGALRVDPPLKPVDGAAGCLVREHRATSKTTNTKDGRYLAILDYLPVDGARMKSLNAMRQRIRAATRMATTHGVGPRYLHSTGQYHKGGPNTGVFVLLTAPDATTTAVPGTDYSFSVLKQAQALGDFDALVAAGRDVLHFHFDDPGVDCAAAVEHVLRIRALLN